MTVRAIRAPRFSPSAVFLALSIVGIGAGAAFRLADARDAADVAWAVTTAVGILPIGWEVLRGILRREPGVDLIAVLAMVGALAFE
ncbi:MAG: hypothetical protein ACXWXK_05945 [Actinomycetota bacterium]